GLEGPPTAAPLLALLTGAGYGLDSVRLQIQGAEEMILAVGDIKGVAVESHPLRIVETGRFEGPVRLTRLTLARHGDLLAGLIRNDNTVMGAVGDENAPTGDVGQDLAREEQRTIAALTKAGEIEAEWLFVEFLALVAVVGNQFANQ